MDIFLFTKSVQIHLNQKGKRGIKSGDCSFETLCERLDWQLSFVSGFSSQLSPLLKSVSKLYIFGDDRMPSGEDMDSTQWLELFQPFTRVRDLGVSGQFVPDIVQALVTEDMAAGVLPELAQLFVTRMGEAREQAAVVEATEQFVASRKLSGRTTTLV